MKPLLLLLFIFTFSAYPNVANALEELNYSDNISTSLKPQIDGFLKQTYKTNLSLYYIANNDLNNDGQDEYILKRKQCDTQTKRCTHLIIAKTNEPQV